MPTRSALFLPFALAIAIPATATAITADPTCGAGTCSVPGFDLFGIVSSSTTVDVVFANMEHIELQSSATTNIEFGIGNTGGTADLDYTIRFDLSDENGDLITTDALVVVGTAQAGFTDIQSLPLTPLPAVIFHDFHISVDTTCQQASACPSWDLRVAGGGGDSGTFVSGPIVFNRALGGVWEAPEPALPLAGAALATGLVVARRQSTKGQSRRALRRSSPAGSRTR